MSWQNGYRDVMANEADRGRAFADLIRNARKDKGWTQDVLVAESGVTKSTLVRWESGRAERPDPDQVKTLCRTLGLDPRLAAIALGYLDESDLNAPPPRRIDPAILEVIEALEDPTVPTAKKEEWVEYLRYLRQRSRAAG